jgi:hypothetical protein
MILEPENIAAIMAVAVFVAVLLAFHSTRARREREAARREWQADLRTRGA